MHVEKNDTKPLDDQQLNFTVPEQIISIGDIEGFFDALADARERYKIKTIKISTGCFMHNGALAIYHCAYLEIYVTELRYQKWRDDEKLKKYKAGNSNMAKA